MDKRVRDAYYWFLMPDDTIFMDGWSFEYVHKYQRKPIPKIKRYISRLLNMGLESARWISRR